MDQKERRTIVIGHKNPDTDSICSAIGYASLKRAVTGGRYVPARAGSISRETKFVLDYFGAVHNRPAVRPATADERDEYRRIRAEIAQEDVLFSAHRAGIQSQEETPWS